MSLKCLYSLKRLCMDPQIINKKKIYWLKEKEKKNTDKDTLHLNYKQKNILTKNADKHTLHLNYKQEKKIYIFTDKVNKDTLHLNFETNDHL